jgi:hypothetical protein
MMSTLIDPNARSAIARTVGALWVCQDCYLTYHGYDVEPPDPRYWDEQPEPLSEVPNIGHTVAGWRLDSLSDWTYPNGDNPDDPDETGEREFGREQCDGCGSRLAGQRHRLATHWENTYRVEAEPSAHRQPRVIDTDPEFRQLASEWHGGQASALYAYASTGSVTVGLLGEINNAYKFAHKWEPQDVEPLRRFQWHITPMAEAVDAYAEAVDRAEHPELY